VTLTGADGQEGDFGEFWVRNPGVTPGYHNLPAVNAERIVDVWLKTGDRCRRDAGGFCLEGCTDDMFKGAGESIRPKEVENLLMRHPGVADACVVPVNWGDMGQAPVAMVMLRAPMAADEAALKALCLAHGPAYAHPRHVVITTAIPLNGAGKNDRTIVQRELEARFGRGGG